MDVPTIVVSILLFVGIWLLLRPVNTWYLKINRVLKNQDEILALLKEMKTKPNAPTMPNKTMDDIVKRASESWQQTSVNDPAVMAAILKNLPKKD